MRMILIAATVAATLAGPALATGKMKCTATPEQRQPIETLKAELVKQGWTVAKAKVDGGCYEVYGVMPETGRVEAYFDPITFEKLYVEQRGKVIFKKG
ncbi:PepSY domain-containing protein [Sandarakinorhabdus sp.]|uniref:PepSY domain-containing protein n=1 Tax=Sandarakinorhabdus sp. TaxID=1916663 RepID=UPI003F6ECDA9